MKRDKFGRNCILTTEEYVEKCKLVHGCRYDYSKVIYKGSAEDVIVVCKIHGDFIRNASVHSCGGGCLHCAEEVKTIKRSKKEGIKFVKEGSRVHNNKYSYDKVVYVRSDQEVIITCPIHGDFKQRPANHKRGAGCQECGLQKLRDNFKLSQEEVMGRSFEKFKVDFNIDLTNYDNINSLVTFYCPVHGKFEDKVSNHLASDDGCSKCFNEKDKVSWNRTSVEENMIALKKLYNNKYHFFQEDIKTNSHKVRYYCFKHKKLYRTKLRHLLDGHSCRDCGKELASEKLTGKYNTKIIERNSKFFKEDPNNVYLLKLTNSIFKIGIAKDVIHRGQSIKSATEYTPEVIFTKGGSTYACFYLEQKLHEVFKDFRFYSKTPWKGHTEVFTLNADQVNEVISYINGETL